MPPVITLDDWQRDWENGMCSVCIAIAQALHEKGRKQAWDDLPSAFGLPSWDELLKA